MGPVQLEHHRAGLPEDEEEDGNDCDDAAPATKFKQPLHWPLNEVKEAILFGGGWSERRHELSVQRHEAFLFDNLLTGRGKNPINVGFDFSSGFAGSIEVELAGNRILAV